MPTQAEIARHLRVSRAYICKLVKQGMPLDSFKSARSWKNAHASRRASTNPTRLAKLVSKACNNHSPEARHLRKEYIATRPDGTKIPSRDLEDALFKAILVADEAHRLVIDAMAQPDDSLIQVRVGIHNKALENRIKVEAAIQELQERRKILVPLDAATAIYRRGLDVIMRRLKRLGQEKAAACNPQNPHHALAVLENWVEEMLAEVQAQYTPAC